MKTRFLHKTRLKVWQAKSSLQDFECALTKIPKIISRNSVPYFAMIHQKCPCCIISPRVRATDLLVDKKNRFHEIRAIILTRAKFLFFFEVENLEIVFL